MIIERADRIINLCKMKFSTDRYAITDNYEMKLRERMERIKEKALPEQEGSASSNYIINYVVLFQSFQLLHQQMRVADGLFFHPH